MMLPLFKVIVTSRCSIEAWLITHTQADRQKGESAQEDWRTVTENFLFQMLYNVMHNNKLQRRDFGMVYV